MFSTKLYLKQPQKIFMYQWIEELDVFHFEEKFDACFWEILT